LGLIINNEEFEEEQAAGELVAVEPRSLGDCADFSTLFFDYHMSLWEEKK